MAKDPLKVQNRTLGFNTAEDKMFIDTASDSTLQLTLRNYHLSSSDTYNIKRRYTKKSSEKAIKQSSLFQLHVCLIFFIGFKQNNTATALTEGQMGESGCPLLSQILKI